MVSVVKHWVGYGVMPAYSMPAAPFTAKGSLAPLEPVGLGFSRPLLTDVLRGRFGFDGVILSDWRITSDCTPGCRDGAPAGRRASFADIAMPWGVEELPKLDRYVKGVDAGLDQFGGVAEPEFIVEAVKAGRLGGERIDRSAYRVLLQKFQLGLFEDAFADADAATKTVGNPDGSGRRAAVLPLPPASQTRVYLHQFDAQAAREVVPTVVSIYLERPADLRAIEGRAAAIVGHFGLTPAALFDVLTGRHAPTGRLPYDLPWAPSAGAATAGGAFRLGQGLGY